MCAACSMYAGSYDSCVLTAGTSEAALSVSACNDSVKTAADEDVRTLAQRADSLEHELKILKILHDWEIMRLNFEDFQNKINIRYNAIKTNMYIRNFDAELYKEDQKIYGLFVTQLSKYDEILNKAYSDIDSKDLKSNTSSKERLKIMLLISSTDYACSFAHQYLSLYKSAIEEYGKKI